MMSKAGRNMVQGYVLRGPDITESCVKFLGVVRGLHSQSIGWIYAWVTRLLVLDQLYSKREQLEQKDRYRG